MFESNYKFWTSMLLLRRSPTMPSIPHPQIQNLEPGTLNPKPCTLNPKPHTLNFPNLKLDAPNAESYNF